MHEIMLGTVGGVGATVIAFLGGANVPTAIALIALGAAIAVIVQYAFGRSE